MPQSLATPGPFAVAAIGASSGGVEALLEVLAQVPRGSGLACLVLVHVEPTHQNLLTEILTGKMPLRVQNAEVGQRVEPDTVYVMPPGLGVVRHEQGLMMESMPPAALSHHAIDELMGCLSREMGEKAIGVVLSGTGEDGAMGLSAIRLHGGTALVQSPESARYDDMPCHAIEEDCADCVLAPAELGQVLSRMGRHGTVSPDGSSACFRTDDLAQVFAILRSVSGIDFSLYKSSTIQRRLSRRLSLHHLDSIEPYLTLLQREPAEAMSLCQDFLIQVTEFFREREWVESLATDVFPRLVQDRAADDPIRIWVPGCSTGEEVYSIAILLREFLDRLSLKLPLILFGSDLSREAIDRARLGIYSAEALGSVSVERRERFFSRVEGGFQIRPEVRDLCVFAKHNVARDPPFSKLDLISCCNLLIYFGQALQKRVISTFHYALKPGGVLRLGSSERVGSHGAKLFCQIDRQRPFYVRRNEPIDLPTELGPITENLMSFGPPRQDCPQSPSPPDSETIQREMERLILASYAPAGLVVDQYLEVVRFTGQVAPYLQPQPGSASLNLGKLVESGLQIAISSAINEARRRNARVRREHLRIQSAPEERLVNLEVSPLGSSSGSEPYFLVLFENAESQRTARKGWLDQLHAFWSGSERTAADSSLLLAELETARNDLRGMLDAHELGQDELKSMREELLSAREEFQSTNEELETAQEELKSANEELITANEELRIRNAELNRTVGELREARDYAQAIVDTVRDGLLVLDADLRVRRANRAILDILRLPSAAVEGLSLAEIGYGALASAPILDKLKVVAGGGPPIEHCEFPLEIPQAGSRILFAKARQLAGEGELAGLVLLSLADVTERWRDAARLRQQGELLDQAHEAIFAWILGGTIRYWNRGAMELLGYSREEAIGRVSHELLQTRRELNDAEFERLLREHRSWIGEVIHTTRDGQELIMDSRYTVQEQQDGSLLVLETNRDITERKQWEESLRRADRQKDEFLAMLAHELRNPLAPLRNALAIVERSDPGQSQLARLRPMMERQVTKLTRIVDDLLDIARITRGQIELRKERTDLVALVRNAVEASRPQVIEAGHGLLVSFPEQAIMIDADPVRVEQILENLLSNAIRYTAAGGEIRISLNLEKDMVVLRVADNGQGISEQALPHIFDLFVQSDRSLDRRQGGLGIGLTLVRRLAELHGGWVTAESDGVGLGSCFRVGFPLAVSGLPATVSPPALPRRILVVDQNREAADSLAFLAKTIGHQVRVAYDAITAMASALDFKPDTVLLDIGLPGRSGSELARNLRALPGLDGVLLVAVSSFGLEDGKAASEASGIDYHLAKPVNVEALERLIGRAQPPYGSV